MPRRGRRAEPVLRAVVVAALAVDAVVHYRSAGPMGLAAPGGIGGDTLFRVQATAAVLAAVFLLITGSRIAYSLAALAALSALVPVLLYTLVDVPALGPIPSMYDPTWSAPKLVSAAAEALALVLAVAGVRVAGRRPRSGWVSTEKVGTPSRR
ncbi:hypothetical protein [Georgenia deserti]|uniref:Integral membrane protein n=1 Tax=Georgenia deserti TaxID=2093781 RepID=A0ABW4KY64_9MICO